MPAAPNTTGLPPLPLNAPTLLIRPKAISANLAALRAHVHAYAGSAAPRLWAVLKADAYGHGLVPTLSAVGLADGVAVGSLAELYDCRAAGWTKPILLLGLEQDVLPLADPSIGQVHFVLHDEDQIQTLAQLPPHLDLHIWLRHAGQLNFSGLKGQAYAQAYQQLQALLKRKIIAGLGHLQHYAYAEDPERLQNERAAMLSLQKALPGPLCTENSSALLASPQFAAHTQWVRSGVALYGINPLPGPSPIVLQAAMTLRAPLIAVQTLAPNEHLGYQASYTSPHHRRVGIVHCGYGFGYPRQIGSGCPCAVDGQASVIVGRVSMDTLCVDLHHLPHARVGSQVSLWGEHGIHIEDVAACAGTIAAQLCTGLTARVQRHYLP